ncbi:MAG: glycosyltransferase [Planctomycetota bacterium]
MHLLLSNLNPSWGGGEFWFFDAANELAARGHEVRVLVREGSQLQERLRPTGLELVSEEIDPFQGRKTDVMLCNSRKKDVKHLMQFKTRPAHGLLLRKGVPRPLKDRMWGRKELHALCHVLVNSDATRAVVQESLPWFPPERITRIYNPVPFEPAAAEPGMPLRICAVGRLVAVKGFDVLLEAVGKLQRDWTLAIAGEGRAREELEPLAAPYGDRVRFLGHLEDVRPVYAAADLMVVSSRYEGFCYSAVEATIAALPVIATEVGSLPEVVPDARFVPSEDPVALAAAIEATQPGPRPDEAARARARFAPDRIFEELERLLEQVASEGPVRG